MRYSLDTSAYSHFVRGHVEAAELIDQAAWIGVSAVVLGELHAGFRMGNRRADNERGLSQFLANPVVHVLSIDDDAAALYGELVVELKQAGTPLPTNDIWIAAVSARDGATILTFDEHFRSIRRVGSRVLA